MMGSEGSSIMRNQTASSTQMLAPIWQFPQSKKPKMVDLTPPRLPHDTHVQQILPLVRTLPVLVQDELRIPEEDVAGSEEGLLGFLEGAAQREG